MAANFLFPNDAQGQLVPIDDLPVGETVDNIFYLQNSDGYYKRILDGGLRASHCGILDTGFDMTARLVDAMDNPKVVDIIFDYPSGTVIIDGDVTIPDGKRLIFRNNCVIDGEGTLTGGFVLSDLLTPCFGEHITVKELQNRVISPMMFRGCIPDDATDCTDHFKKALDALKNGFNSNPTYISSNATLYIPGIGRFYLTDSLVIRKVINIAGDNKEASGLRFTTSMGKSALVFKFLELGDPITKGSTRCYVHDFSIYGNAGETGSSAQYDNLSHGIFIETGLNTFSRIGVHYFTGANWRMTGSGPTTNANNNHFYDIEGVGGGKGMYINGADANLYTCMNCNFTGNAVWDFHDYSFLGGTTINMHLATGGVENVNNQTSVNHNGGEYWCIQDHVGALDKEPGTSGGNAYWHYSRADMNQHNYYKNWAVGHQYLKGGSYYFENVNQFGKHINMYEEGAGEGYPPGTNLGLASIDCGFATINNPRGYWKFTGEGYVTENINSYNVTDKVFTFMRGNSYMGFYDVDNNLKLGFKHWKAGKAFSISQGGSDGDVWFYSNVANAARIGRSSWPGTTNVVFDNGVFVSNGAGEGRNITMATTAPVPTAKAIGDITFKSNPSTGEPLGWRKTSDGSIEAIPFPIAPGSTSLTNSYIGFGDGSNLLSGTPELTYQTRKFKVENISPIVSLKDSTVGHVSEWSLNVAGPVFPYGGFGIRDNTQNVNRLEISDTGAFKLPSYASGFGPINYLAMFNGNGLLQTFSNVSFDESLNKFTVVGTFNIANLAGSGTRDLVVDASGNVSVVPQLTLTTIESSGGVSFNSSTRVLNIPDTKRIVKRNLITTNTTLDNTYYYVAVDAASGNVTVTLPTSGLSPGQMFIIKRIDASGNTVNVSPGAGQTFDGVSTPHALSSKEFITFIYSGATDFELLI